LGKVKEGKTQKTVLRSKEVYKIVNTFIQKQEIDDFSKIVTYEEMKNKNCSFSAGQYFDIKIEYIDITKEEFENKLQEYKNNLKSYFEESNKLEKKIFEQLSGLKYE